jgi:hypothetical protein
MVSHCTTVIIPDVDNFDWDTLAARIESIELESFSSRDLFRAFADAGEYDPTIYPTTWLDYEGHSAQTPQYDSLRAILRQDLRLIRERAQNPERYVRDTREEGESYGYGFEAIWAGEHLILVGTYNEEEAAKMETSTTTGAFLHPESCIFGRFLDLDLLNDSAQVFAH